MPKIPFAIVGFDLDGTLLDTHEDLAAAVNHALALAGRAPVVPAKVRAMIGGGAKRMLSRALKDSGGVPEGGFDALYAALLDHYEANIAVHTSMFPGGEAMLDDLAAEGVKLAVVTNKMEHLALRLLDALRLSGRFATIIGGDTLGPGRGKPAPDLLYAMRERLGGGRAAYVGDTTYDTGAAKAAGMPCVAVSFGFNDLPAKDLGADSVISHFCELVPALAKL